MWQKNAYMDTVVMTEWSRFYAEKINFRENEENHALLAMDNFGPHLKLEKRLIEEYNTECLFTAADCTDMLMPIDQISAQFKAKIYEFY